MEDKIFDILTDLIRHDIGKNEALSKLLDLFNVSESVCDACNGFGGRSAKLGMGHLSCPKCHK